VKVGSGTPTEPASKSNALQTATGRRVEQERNFIRRRKNTVNPQFSVARSSPPILTRRRNGFNGFRVFHACKKTWK
jgi:hypothetical protein